MDKNEQKTIGVLDGAQINCVLDIIQSLNGTLINIKRYPPGSAIVNMAMERGLESFAILFEKVDNITFSENEQALLVDDEMMEPKIQGKAFIVSFLAQMRARNLRSITFRKGVSREEMVAFLDVLSESPEGVKNIQNISDFLYKKGVTNIDIDKKVFVAIGRGQAVANLSEIENLSRSKGGSLSQGDVKDGMFLSFLLSKLPMKDFNLGEKDLEKLKGQIDYDRLKDARNIDFEKLGPLLAAAMEKIMDLDYDALPEPSFEPGDAEQSDDPEIRRETRLKNQADFKDRDERVEKLINTFKTISESIVSFKNPEVRAKLLTDFIKIITNFKSITLARVLTTQMENSEGIDVKNAILVGLSLQKKSKVVDLLLQRLDRFVEGLSAMDFEIDLDEIKESEKILSTVLSKMKNSDEKKLFSDKLNKGIGLARLIRKEATDPNSLLILKMRRMIVKSSDSFLDDDFLNNFSDLVGRLNKARRPDIVKKLLEKISENLEKEDIEDRLSAINAFVQIQKDLYYEGHLNVVADIYNIFYRRMNTETDSHVFALLLASIVSGFSNLITSQKFTLATNIIQSLQKLKISLGDPARREILTEGLSNIVRSKDQIELLLDAFKSEDEGVSEGAVKVLMTLPVDAILPQFLLILRDSDNMRIRKKCTNTIGKFGTGVVAIINQELTHEQPWYYLRNLINLLASAATDDVVSTVGVHIHHADSRVRKACVNTLIKNGSTRAEEILAETINDEDEAIIRMIVAYFGQTRSHIGSKALMNMLTNQNLPEARPDLASEIILAVGRVGHPDSTDALIKLIKPGGLKGLFQKRNDPILTAVLKAFALLRDPKGAVLAKRYVRDKNPLVAKAAKIAVQSVE